MAKEEVEVKKEVKSERQSRWEAFLETYKKSNPAKYESRKKEGKLDSIPESFV
jgi:hypothetical protein